MAFAKATLIQRVRDILGTEEFEDRITADPTTGTTITVPDTTKWAKGNVLEFQDDGERALVRSIDTSTTMTVKRGHGGTTAASSHASGVVIIRNPVYPYSRISDAITQTINTLWPWAWHQEEVQITPDITNKRWYNLTATCIDLIQAFQLTDGTPTRVRYFGHNGSLKPITIARGLPTSLVASGVGVLFDRGLYDSDNTIYVHCRAKVLTTVSGGNYSDLTDGIETETVAWGAAARLVMAREIPRISEDDTSMGDATVEPGNRWSIGREVQRKYKELLNDWYDELMRTIPPAKKWSK